jgi:hypothetical protein
MYKELSNKDMIKAHDALSDVEHTGKCYAILQNLIHINNLVVDMKPHPKKKLVLQVDKDEKQKTKKNRVIRTLELDNNPIKVKPAKKTKKITKDFLTKQSESLHFIVEKNQKQPADILDSGLTEIINKNYF